jgi:phosphatidylserine/phosphatidylglycerophosphate/cardiolipin synthase-like enzyme
MASSPAPPRTGPHATPHDWFLSVAERGNSFTAIDSRHPDHLAWTEGNAVRPLVHGATYFRTLHRAVQQMTRGDLLLFTDWRGDPDERLDGPGSEVGDVLAAAARRGVDVRGLVWRSHWDRLQFSASENRHLGAEIEKAGGQCLLDMRVRTLGSHHQKLVVLRHPGREELDVAFIGGIDLCHSRHDDADHAGDPQRQPMAAVYGPRPPWHDIQLEIQGPAVGDAEAVFRERWEDPALLSRNPLSLLGEHLRRQDPGARPLPPQLPDPAPRGTLAVQLLRTYADRHHGYRFAPQGERSIARGYAKAIRHARSLIYIEDQYLWSLDVARVFAQALVNQPNLRLLAVIPGFPDQDGRTSLPPNLLGREGALALLKASGGERVAVYSLENSRSTPIYVHAKVCIIDDAWACVGSDNANRRSWTHDSELSAAVMDTERSGGSWAKDLRLTLATEHLGISDEPALEDAHQMFELFRRSALALDSWHDGGDRGPRPAGQVRTYEQQPLSRWTRAWATPLYRTIYDPDGRSPRMRRKSVY